MILVGDFILMFFEMDGGDSYFVFKLKGNPILRFARHFRGLFYEFSEAIFFFMLSCGNKRIAVLSGMFRCRNNKQKFIQRTFNLFYGNLSSVGKELPSEC